MSTGPCFFCGRSGAWCELCRAFICSDPVCQAKRVHYAVAHPDDTVKKIVDYYLGR